MCAGTDGQVVAGTAPRSINFGGRAPGGARGDGGGEAAGRAEPHPTLSPARGGSGGISQAAFPASWPPHTARARLQGV